jgi:biotin carboxyl carrier protein
MKLFNEIKCDVTGTVRRIAVENGALVKARQTLVEVEPA